MPKPTAAASGSQVPPMIDVVSVKYLDGYKLRVGFSDGSAGVHDFSSTAARDGEMVRPLKDPAFFARVFIELGALAWPNGFDLDPIALHERMAAAGELIQVAAEQRVGSVPSRSAIASALRHIAPHLPAHEFAAVVDHAMDSPGLSVATPENAAFLSLVAYARHTFTEYDALLAEGHDRDSARFFVAEELADLLAGWGVKRKLGEGE